MDMCNVYVKSVYESSALLEILCQAAVNYSAFHCPYDARRAGPSLAKITTACRAHCIISGNNKTEFYWEAALFPFLSR